MSPVTIVECFAASEAFAATFEARLAASEAALALVEEEFQASPPVAMRLSAAHAFRTLFCAIASVCAETH